MSKVQSQALRSKHFFIQTKKNPLLEIYEILESVKTGKISVNSAKKLLSLYSIEEGRRICQN